eukprot:6484749-Amphidinium_carterae.1
MKHDPPRAKKDRARAKREVELARGREVAAADYMERGFVAEAATAELEAETLHVSGELARVESALARASLWSQLFYIGLPSVAVGLILVVWGADLAALARRGAMGFGTVLNCARMRLRQNVGGVGAMFYSGWRRWWYNKASGIPGIRLSPSCAYVSAQGYLGLQHDQMERRWRDV